jgi:Flp pilus assembly protein TadD
MPCNRRIPLAIVGMKLNMAFRLGAWMLTAILAATPSLAADARLDAKAQVEFGIDVAQRGLWREAIYRWERAAQIDPTYAAAYNNLAVAYEHEGQLDKARQAYEKALEIEPNNAQIRQNYELFKEINDRTSAAKERP